MCVNISASVALACLFIPKVYIVLFQPHKNVRQGATKIKGLAAGGMSFFGRPATGIDAGCPSMWLLTHVGQNVEFNENGDAKGRYTIYQFLQIEVTNEYNYVPISNRTDR